MGHLDGLPDTSAIHKAKAQYEKQNPEQRLVGSALLFFDIAYSRDGSQILNLPISSIVEIEQIKNELEDK